MLGRWRPDLPVRQMRGRIGVLEVWQRPVRANEPVRRGSKPLHCWVLEQKPRLLYERARVRLIRGP